MARLDAEIFGDEAAETLALGVVEAGVLEAPAAEFEPFSHGPLMRWRAAFPPFTAFVEMRRSNVARCPSWATANASK